MAEQMMLFVVEQERRKDGSFIVRPTRVQADRDIGTKAAMKLLGMRDREAFYKLVNSGQISAWRLPSARKNAKFRVSEQSVLAFRDGRKVSRAG